MKNGTRRIRCWRVMRLTKSGQSLLVRFGVTQNNIKSQMKQVGCTQMKMMNSN